jgi:hypothetical protein
MKVGSTIMQRVFQGLVASLLLTCAVLPAAARNVVPAEKRFWSYDGVLPACDSPGVLSRMSDRFQQAEHEYWNSPLEVESYDHVRTVGLRPWGLDHIPRNFCQARALLNDHSYHTVSYSVIEDAGIIGMDFGVEFCFAGLDREFAYAPRCKMEQP